MHTEHTLMITPVNGSKIADIISKKFPPKEGETYRVESFGFLHNISLDNECVYHSIDDIAMSELNGIQPVELVPVRKSKKNADGTTSMSIFPSFCVPFTISELEAIADDKLSLKDFMGRRYDYNPRIRANMKDFLADVGSQIPVE